MPSANVMALPVPVESVWTALNGWNIHARRAAPQLSHPRRSIVLVHGLGVSSRYMVPTAELLGREYDVYALDLPGFGRSTKPGHVLDLDELTDVLAAWVEARALGAPVLLGNSFGCQVVVNYAIRHPGRLQGAVLVGPTTDPDTRGGASQLAVWLLDSPRESPSLTPIIARDYLDCGIPRLLRTYGIAIGDFIEGKLPHVHVPTLVVRGARDLLVPQRWAEEVTALLPDGSLSVIPGSGHTVNYMAPLELTRVTRGFVEGMT